VKVTNDTKPVGWFKSDPRNARKHSTTQRGDLGVIMQL
jgi:hypothetical protein